MVYHTKRYMMGDPTMEKQFWEVRHFLKMNEDSLVRYEVLVNGEVVYERIVTNIEGNDNP